MDRTGARFSSVRPPWSIASSKALNPPLPVRAQSENRKGDGAQRTEHAARTCRRGGRIRVDRAKTAALSSARAARVWPRGDPPAAAARLILVTGGTRSSAQLPLQLVQTLPQAMWKHRSILLILCVPNRRIQVAA